MRARVAALVACIAIAAPVPAQVPPSVPLWPAGAPGTDPARPDPDRVEDGYVRHVGQPSLTVLPADRGHANGVGIVVVPGGGHRMLVVENEGLGPARVLNRFGVTAFVLRYRLAREPGARWSIERDAVADAARAVRWVRAHAAEYGVDPHRVGLMGFSAGGELVALVADNPPLPVAHPDPVDRQSARPDFQVLIYPGPLGTPGTAVAGAPPAFLAAGTLDECCAAPTLALYGQLRAAHVSAELHLFADTGHGFNIAAHAERLSLQHWPDRLHDWLADGGWLVPNGRAVPGSTTP